MNSEYEWNLKEIFENKEEFEQTKTSLREDLNQIKTYEGKLCESEIGRASCRERVSSPV